jgi:hypothetical protein
MAAMQANSVNLTGEAEPVRLVGLRVSAGLFPKGDANRPVSHRSQGQPEARGRLPDH